MKEDALQKAAHDEQRERDRDDEPEPAEVLHDEPALEDGRTLEHSRGGTERSRVAAARATHRTMWIATR